VDIPPDAPEKQVRGELSQAGGGTDEGVSPVRNEPGCTIVEVILLFTVEKIKPNRSRSLSNLTCCLVG